MCSGDRQVRLSLRTIVLYSALSRISYILLHGDRLGEIPATEKKRAIDDEHRYVSITLIAVSLERERTKGQRG